MKPSDAPTSDKVGRRRRLRPSAAVGIWILLAACVFASYATARTWRASVIRLHRNQFEASSSDVAASMESALRRSTDLVASLRSTVAADPTMTNAEFRAWVDGTGATTRYPGGIGFAYFSRVPRAGLDAYKAAAAIDPIDPKVTPRPFVVLPPGDRPFYCFTRLGWSPANADSTISIPPGLDYCSNAGIYGVVTKSVSSTLQTAADTGEFTVQTIDVGNGLFGIVAPVFRAGATPTTVAQRWEALIGWAVASFDGETILANGGGTRRNTQVEISHRNSGEKEPALLVSAGRARGAMSRSITIEADGKWEVRVSGSPDAQGFSADAQFWGLLLTGLALSGLLFGFVRVLTRTRSEALQLVEDKTGELRYQAMHDGLTGLPNRALILDRIDGALARARRHNTPVAVMFLDLDGFKGVNDKFGHAAGDQLLRDVAGRLLGMLRESDTVGRLGGDEFVVLVEGDSLDAGPEVVAERIREVLKMPFTLETGDSQTAVHARASIGIAVGFRATGSELLRDADVALYEAKDSGKDCFVVFAPEMQTANQRRLELELELREAVASDQFRLVYQPTFDLRTGTATGVEALIRWHHPTRGLVMPDEFIPLAEHTALIVPMGRWVLREACRQAVVWRDRGHALGVSVNVSGRQLDDDVDIVADVRRALFDSGLAARSLTLELTETMLMRDALASARKLRALKALGVRIAIDDFGTGYCSLAYLEQFPVDALKIDRSFISGIANSSEPSALIHTLVQLGKTLGIETLAEGIEDEVQLARLQLEDCDSGQGYLFARPLHADAVEAFMEAHTAKQASTP